MAAGTAKQPVLVGDDEDELPCNNMGPPVNAQGRKLKSEVWQHMTREVFPDKSIKTTCKYCGEVLTANKGSGTSHLKRHIDKCIKRVNHDIRNFCISVNDKSATLSLRNPAVNFEEVRRSIGVYIVAGVNSEEMGFINFMNKRRRVSNIKSELEIYLDEGVEDCEILSYWKKNCARFPNLSCMARDILAIPISTVPSESAFSMGKKLINPWRASLGETTIEALACYEDWLRGTEMSSGPSVLFGYGGAFGIEDNDGEEEKEEADPTIVGE